MSINSKMNLREEIDYIKNNIDVNYIIKSLGFNVVKESHKELRAACIIHGGDNESAFRFNKEKNTWVCFTNRCHEVYGNDIIGLVMSITKKDFVSALEYIKQFVPDFGSEDYVSFKRQREIDNFISLNDNKKIKPKEVNNDSLEKFKPLRSIYFNSKGFSDDVLDHFEIAGGWIDSNRIPRDIIPIRNDLDELVAFSLRDIRPEPPDEDFKYILTPDFDKDSCLYNLNRAYVYGSKLPLILVEGFKSVWRLHEYGIKNVVSIMGSHITEGQQFLLYMYAMKGVVLFLDNDKAGATGTSSALAAFHGRLPAFPVYIKEVDSNGKGLDPADLSKELVYEYLKGYY